MKRSEFREKMIALVEARSCIEGAEALASLAGVKWDPEGPPGLPRLFVDASTVYDGIAEIHAYTEGIEAGAVRRLTTPECVEAIRLLKLIPEIERLLRPGLRDDLAFRADEVLRMLDGRMG